MLSTSNGNNFAFLYILIELRYESSLDSRHTTK